MKKPAPLCFRCSDRRFIYTTPGQDMMQLSVGQAIVAMRKIECPDCSGLPSLSQLRAIAAKEPVSA